MKEPRIAAPLVSLYVVWLVLVSATALMWWVRVDGATNWGTYASAIIIVIAFIKIRLVLAYFMQTRHAPALLRLLLDAWVFGVAAGVLFFLGVGGHHA